MKGKANMNSRIKLSNKIFDLGLSTQELAVYTYLCSLPSDYPMLDGAVVKVKQSTIAQKCGIKAVQTVAKVINSLSQKALVTPLKRSVKQNGYKGTYIYEVKKLPTTDSFFFAERSVYGQLIPRQIMIYLFLCKAYSVERRESWNSFNDIAQQTGMKRETVIETVSELEKLRYIRRSRRKARDNRRVYVDNHYFLITYVRGSIRKKQGKKIARLYCEYNRTCGLSSKINTFINPYTITKRQICQEVSAIFFASRGSP